MARSVCPSPPAEQHGGMRGGEEERQNICTAAAAGGGQDRTVPMKPTGPVRSRAVRERTTLRVRTVRSAPRPRQVEPSRPSPCRDPSESEPHLLSLSPLRTPSRLTPTHASLLRPADVSALQPRNLLWRDEETRESGRFCVR